MADRVITYEFRASYGDYTRATAAMGAETEGLNRSTTNADGSMRRLGADSQQTSSAFRRGSADIDKFSGRLGVLVKSALVLGPALVPIAAQSVPAIAALVAGFGAAATAAGVTVLAFRGVGDALTAVNKANLDPSTASIKAMHEALSQLPPATASFVSYLSQIEPQFKQLQSAAARGLFPGLEQGINDLLPQLPKVRSFINEISTEVGRLASEAGTNLTTDPVWTQFFGTIKQDGVPVLDDFAKSLGNLTKGFAGVMNAFEPENRSFLQGMEMSTKAFANWSAGLKNSQSFHDFIDYLHTSGPTVHAFFSALGHDITSFAQAVAPWGTKILPVLTDVGNVFSTIADSPIGPVIYDAAAALLLFNGAVKILGPTSALALGMKSLTAQAIDLKLAVAGVPAAAGTTTVIGGGAAGAGAAGATSASRASLVASLKTAETEYAAALARSTEALTAVRVAEGQLVVARAEGDAALVAETEETLALTQAQLAQARSATVAASATKFQAEAAAGAVAPVGLLGRASAVAGNGLVRTGLGIGGTLLALDGISGGHSRGTSTAETAVGGAAIGAMFGPWGAAIGAGVGALAGFVTHLHSASAATSNFALDMSSVQFNGKGAPTPQSVGQIAQGLSSNGLFGQAAQFGISQQQVLGAVTTGNTTGINSTIQQGIATGQIPFNDDTIKKWNELGSAIKQNSDNLKTTKTAADAAQSAFDSAGGSAQQLAARLAVQSQNAHTAAKAWISLGDSVNDTKTSLNGWIRDMQDQAAALRDFTKNAQTAANKGLRDGLIKELEAAGPAGALRMKQLANATKTQITAANRSWDSGISAMRKYVAFKVPPKDPEVNIGKAMDGIRTLQASLAALHDKRINILTNYANVGPGILSPAALAASQGKAKHSALGSTVPDDGGPYSDRFHYLLAPREEIVSDRFGGASKNRGALKAASRGATLAVVGYAAAGATVGSGGSPDGGHHLNDPDRKKPNRGGLSGLLLEAVDRMAKQLEHSVHAYHDPKGNLAFNDVMGKFADGKLSKRLDQFGTAVDKSKQKLQDEQQARASLVSSLQSSITGDPFGATQTGSVFSQAYAAGSFGSVQASLQQSKTNAGKFEAAIKVLKAAGVTGGALNFILSAPDPLAAAQSFAAQSKPSLTAYTALYGTEQKAANQAAQYAGQVQHGAPMRSDQKELKALQNELHSLRQEQKQREAAKKRREAAAQKAAKKNSDDNAKKTAAGVKGQPGRRRYGK